MPGITIANNKDKPFSAFGVLSQVLAPLKDTAGKHTHIVLEGFDDYQSHAIVNLLNTSFLSVLSQHGAGATAFTKDTVRSMEVDTSTPNKSINIPLGDAGVMSVSRDEEHKRTVIDLPNFDQFTLPVFQIETLLKNYKKILLETNPRMFEVHGNTYRAFPFNDQRILTVGLQMLSTLAKAHGHLEQDDLFTVRDGLALDMSGRKFPSVLIKEEAFQAIQKAELGSSPPPPPL